MVKSISGKIVKAISFTIVFVVVVIFCSHLAAADSSSYIFSGKDGICEGWLVPTYSANRCEVGVNEEIIKPEEKYSVLFAYKKDATQGWGTVEFIDKDDKNFSNAVKISNVNTATISFFINAGKDAKGHFQGGQDLQIMVDFLKNDNTKYQGKEGKWQMGIKINGFMDGNKIDDDVDTWQEVKIPLKLFIDGTVQPEELIGVTRIILQFYGDDIWKTGVYVTDLQITSTAKKSESKPVKKTEIKKETKKEAKISEDTSGNLLENPGFEDGIQGWRFMSTTLVKGIEYGLDSDNKHSGINSIFVSNTNNNDDKGKISGYMYNETIQCKEGTKMALSCWVKGENLETDSGIIQLHFQAADDSHGPNINVPIPFGTFKWKKVENMFTVPAGMSKITVISLGIDRSVPGKIWFDDIRLEVVE